MFEPSHTPRRINWIDTAFSEADIISANERWGCNCGPAALAAITGLTLDSVRSHIPGFESRRFTNPTMMQAALCSMGVKYQEMDDGPDRKLLSPSMRFPKYGLVRIQWHGPWLKTGVPPAAAYSQTHWVSSMMLTNLPPGTPAMECVYDINGGWETRSGWETIILPEIIQGIPRATGGWHPTHRWELAL